MSNPLWYFETSPEIIRLAVMLYVRFPLSLRNVETSGASISVMRRCATGRTGLARLSPVRSENSVHNRCGNTQWRWHLDKVYVKIGGVTHYLWRAVDHEVEVLESFVTRKRDKAAALTFLKKAMKQYGQLRIIVTDKLRSYRAAMIEIGNEASQHTGRNLNNRAENAHLPFRRRERAMLRFRRMSCLQKFVSIHASIHNHVNQNRSLETRFRYKNLRNHALAEWRQLMAA